MSGERALEIRSFLRERITLEQALAYYLEFERDSAAVLGTSGNWVSHFREEIVANLLSGDELWIFDSDQKAWTNLHGERGLAHVRDGNVIAVISHGRN